MLRRLRARGGSSATRLRGGGEAAESTISGKDAGLAAAAVTARHKRRGAAAAACGARV